MADGLYVCCAEECFRDVFVNVVESVSEVLFVSDVGCGCLDSVGDVGLFPKG